MVFLYIIRADTPFLPGAQHIQQQTDIIMMSVRAVSVFPMLFNIFIFILFPA